MSELQNTLKMMICYLHVKSSFKNYILKYAEYIKKGKVGQIYGERRRLDCVVNTQYYLQIRFYRIVCLKPI